MSSSMLHRDFMQPEERRALFLLQQKNLPLEKMSPEKARSLLSDILSTFSEDGEEARLFRRYLAGAFIFEFIRKNGRHYNRKNFEKCWKWLIVDKSDDYPALDPAFGLAGEKEEEAILQTAARYWYHFRWHAWEPQGMMARGIMGRRKRQEKEQVEAQKEVTLAFIQTNKALEAGKIVRLYDEEGNLLEVLPVAKQEKKAGEKALAVDGLEDVQKQKLLPSSQKIMPDAFAAQKAKSRVK